MPNFSESYRNGKNIIIKDRLNTRWPRPLWSYLVEFGRGRSLRLLGQEGRDDELDLPNDGLGVAEARVCLPLAGIDSV